MTPQEVQQLVDGCACSCCIEALNKAGFDRNPLTGCDCVDFQPAEQCDCALCTRVLSSMVEVVISSDG